MSEEKLTAIIGIRVYPSLKAQLLEEAVLREESLSDYVYDLLMTGWEAVNRENVKQINREVVKQDGKSEKR